ncbi:hypothetical protein PVW53_18955 [Seohaeicola sp. SP36]|uniref:Flp family type IVb pilin n=1 Tax=unclassified Seohaeicola TaxID=2641111 RepID=UPI00237BDFFE|nr:MULTISPECIES: hypothetical protein [unclassified Seohaeicola]MDD9709354.1 hypothetical protein [Seohaeicola sp. 4SK31]MDD9737601.1 hypothetical protein [Seohaeicola sp. SP36]
MIIKAITMLQTFRKEEDGLALTEYLVLLGLLTGAVVLAVIGLGESIEATFEAWATWITTNITAPDDIP